MDRVKTVVVQVLSKGFGSNKITQADFYPEWSDGLIEQRYTAE
ncbi:hypothetical protein [Enterococcus sp. DIV1298c]|nr:hypothetical protein [Enterococcus sp. DIV1298c]